MLFFYVFYLLNVRFNVKKKARILVYFLPSYLLLSPFLSFFPLERNEIEREREREEERRVYIGRRCWNYPLFSSLLRSSKFKRVRRQTIFFTSQTIRKDEAREKRRDMLVEFQRNGYVL